jgi:hypothetical protein
MQSFVIESSCFIALLTTGSGYQIICMFARIKKAKSLQIYKFHDISQNTKDYQLKKKKKYIY